MPTLTVTDARKNLFGLIDDVAEEHRGYCIVGKRNQAVLISMEDWNAIQESLYLNRFPNAPRSSSGELDARIHEAGAEGRKENRVFRPSAQRRAAPGHSRHRPLPNSAALRNTGREPQRRHIPQNQHPAPPRLPGSTGRTRGQGSSHVDPLRVTPQRTADAAKALGGHSQSLVKYHRIHPSILQTRSISLRSVRPESGQNQTSILAAYGLPQSPS